VLFESLRVLNKKKTPCQQTRSFAFYGPGGIRTLDLSDANRTLSHADLKEAPKGQNISFEKWQKHRRNAGFRTSIAFEKKLPFLLQCKKVTLQEKCASDVI